jgi:hypothetical protein
MQEIINTVTFNVVNTLKFKTSVMAIMTLKFFTSYKHVARISFFIFYSLVSSKITRKLYQ